jgi:signal transduction histidine kinase/DNA-binding response OmpR family regulator
MSGSVVQGGPVRVLVVDDDEKNLRALAALLARLPAEIVLARSGEEALRQLLALDFAVILLDVQMPGMSGLETAALIRERERSRRTPIIFLTAFTRTEAQLLGAYRLGAVDFLTKPILPEEVLREKVAWFVEMRRASQLLERERERARSAEAREHERAVADAKRRGEADALRAEMDRQRDLVERLNRSNDRLRLVSTIASQLLLGPAPLDVVQTLFAALSDRLGLEVCLLHLVGPDGALRLWSHCGVPAALVPKLEELPVRELIHGRAAESRRPVVAEDVGRAGKAFPALRLLEVTAGACYPLLVGERLIGTLAYGTRRRSRFDGDELAVLELVADHVAAALERAHLIDELRSRASELAEADRRKDQFLAILAHELRNPLAPILNAVEILRSDAPEQARHRAVDAAGRQVRHMARLIDDLVDVSRIRTGKIELRRSDFALSRAIEDAMAAVDPLLREQRQVLEVELPDEPLPLHADPVRVTQVIENLLHNAAKYTDPGGRVRLSAAAEGSEAVVQITDDGIGIPPELLPRVFDMFVQAEQPANRPRGGLGLGLTLVRSLVELHGGRVSARSDGPGRGSTFEVRLPLGGAPEAGAPGSDGDGEVSIRPLRIAVVEDNADIRETLRELLQRRGHAVAEAGDGPRGVELVVGTRPDVALVDIGLPGMDGYAVAERVRAAQGAATRLVALTGYGGPEERSRAEKAGFDAHLVKPVELSELSRVLAQLV